MKFRKRGPHAVAVGLVVLAGLALAPTAFAHGGVSIGINVPGLSIGVGPHHHAYVGIGGPGYYAPAPVYYSPVAYDDYYYDDAPVYVGGYYGRGYYGGGYYGGGYYGGGYHHRGYRGYDRYQYHYYRGGYGGHHHSGGYYQGGYH